MHVVGTAWPTEQEPACELQHHVTVGTVIATYIGGIGIRLGVRDSVGSWGSSRLGLDDTLGTLG